MLNIKILASCFKKCVIECYLNAFLSGDRAVNTHRVITTIKAFMNWRQNQSRYYS